MDSPVRIPPAGLHHGESDADGYKDQASNNGHNDPCRSATVVLCFLTIVLVLLLLLSCSCRLICPFQQDMRDFHWCFNQLRADQRELKYDW